MILKTIPKLFAKIKFRFIFNSKTFFSNFIVHHSRFVIIFREKEENTVECDLQTSVDAKMEQRMIGALGKMKTISILIVVWGIALAAFADSIDPFEIGSPHFSTNTEIIWKVPTHQLPKKIWTYRRVLPRIFTEEVISNAIVLASLQSKGFPRPSTNDFYISADPVPNCPCPVPDYFGIHPGDAYMYYAMPGHSADSDAKTLNDAAVAAHAWNYARQLGIDPSKLVLKTFYTDFNVDYQNENLVTNGINGRGVFLSRQLDDLMFFSADDQGDGAEGFFFELGSHGKIRAFSVRWSEAERYQSQPVASPQEIIRCIRERKIIVLPEPNEEWYFKRIKKLATAKKFIISKITPYYTDSIFGEVPADNIPCKFITPVAELDAIADFGNSNMTVHLYSPITSSDINRLLGK